MVIRPIEEEYKSRYRKYKKQRESIGCKPLTYFEWMEYKFRGTQCDFSLIKKLSTEPYLNLKGILHKIGIGDKYYGRGYSKEIKGSKGDGTPYIGLPNLEPTKIDQDYKYKYSINPEDLPKFNYEILERERNQKIFHPPLLIIQRGLTDGETRSLYSSKTIIYYNTYFGISFLDVNKRYAHRLNAVFNSKLALYLVFMLGRELGWLKRLIDDRDWLGMPLPLSFLDLENKIWNEIEELEKNLYENWNENNKQSKSIIQNENLLLQKIFEAYKLMDDEKIIVNDAINYNIRIYLKKYVRKEKGREWKEMIKEVTINPSLIQLQKYANKVCGKLGDILVYENKKIVYHIYDIEQKSQLNVIEFEQVDRDSIKTHTTNKIKGINNILNNISDKLEKKVADHLYTRGHLRIYEKEKLIVIKPNEKRFWTESAALNDVMDIIDDHMRFSTH